MKPKPKSTREGPLKIPMKFDDAIKSVMTVKPPPEGWAGIRKEAEARAETAPTKNGSLIY